MKMLLGLILMMSFSCNTVKQDPSDPLIQLTKKRCFGKCPVYDLYVYKDGLVKYNGIDHVKRRGKHEFTLSEDQLTEIKNVFEAAGFETLESQEKKVRDLPITQISFQHKKVQFIGNDIPKEVKKGIEFLERIVGI